MKSLGNYTFWFVVGSQDLYGEEVLKTVDAHTKEMDRRMESGCLTAL